MTPRGLVVAFLIATALSGCTEAPAEPNVAQPADSCTVESPGDYDACGLPATGAPDSVAHVHDYWGGRDRLAVIDEEFGRGTTSLLGSSSIWFMPAEGSIVPQGTSQVEFTFDWEEGPDDVYSQVDLYVKTAATADGEHVGPVTPGETIVFETTNADNDLPHQQLSAWELYLRFSPRMDPAGTRFDGMVSVTMEAVRGLEIPAYEGHPDRWNGLESIPLIDDIRGQYVYHRNEHVGNACVQCWQYHDVNEDRVVPYDAETVVVTIEYLTPNPERLTLHYHGADTREFTTLEPSSSSGAVDTYVIPVGTTGDGPYAKQSLWMFWVTPPATAGLGLAGAVEYNIEAAAYPAA